MKLLNVACISYANVNHKQYNENDLAIIGELFRFVRLVINHISVNQDYITLCVDKIKHNDDYRSLEFLLR